MGSRLRRLSIPGKFACHYLMVRVGAPSSAETRSSPPLIVLRVSNRSVPLKLTVNGVGNSVESITVTTKADDEVPVMVDDEIKHSVCSKREHFDEEIAIITLCKPLGLRVRGQGLTIHSGIYLAIT